MSLYLFEAELPEFTEEIAAMIPEHRMQVDKLFAEQKLISYSVAASRQNLWCIITAEDESQAMEIFVTLPLHPYFKDVACQPLLFHNSQPAELPSISLN